MSLQPPNLDDHTFEDLMQFAKDHVSSYLDADWNKLTPGDPGLVLLELFAYLTDQLIYRLNRLPEKVYISLLRLLGVTLYPPVAATVELIFSNNTDEVISVPAKTRVTMAVGGSDAPIFITVDEIDVPPRSPNGTTDKFIPGQATVWARHCHFFQDEPILSKGTPSFSLTVQQPPIIAPTRDNLEVKVQTLEDGQYVDWEEESNFSNLSPKSRAYVLDRHEGNIWFAPAAQLTKIEVSGASETSVTELKIEAEALAAIPGKDVPIYVSYASGGGVAGNVAKMTLTLILPDSENPNLSKLTVENPRPAVGGQEAETLANALVRGPQEISSLERAITARDFERLVEKADGIARASAITQAMYWKHGQPGVIEIHLVPQVTEANNSVAAVTTAKRTAGERVWEFINLRKVLIDSQPLGTTVLLKWARYKKVWVEASIIVKERQSNKEARDRISKELKAFIDPLGSDQKANRLNWAFGQSLYASDAYRIILNDSAVERVTHLSLCVAHIPNTQIRAIAADYHQPQTWYAGSERTLFQSFNNGEGWEVVPDFPELSAGSIITMVKASPAQPGLVIVWVLETDDKGHFLGSIPFISTDCGGSWHKLQVFEYGHVEDMAWLVRGSIPILILATDKGLFKFELTLMPGKLPEGNYTVIDENPVHAVVTLEKDSQVYVAVARKRRGGIWLANAIYLIYDIDFNWDQANPENVVQNNRQSDTFFRPLRSRNKERDIQGEDIRSLAVQVDSRQNRVYLWAGAMATGWRDRAGLQTEQNAGSGAFCWEFSTQQPLLGTWVQFRGWQGGSCRAIAFAGSTVLAASQWGGALRLDREQQPAKWQQTNSVALPRRRDDVQRHFAPLISLATNDHEKRPLVMIGGSEGLYLSADQGENFSNISRQEFDYRVTLPANWLFVSGDHKILTPNSLEGGSDGSA